MSAYSEKQARLFRLVRALQKGKIKSKEVSPQVRKMARTIKPSSVKHFTKLKEILKQLKENEYSLSKIKKVKGVSFKQHLMKQVGIPFDEKELETFQNKQTGFAGFGKTTFKNDKVNNEIYTEVSSNNTNKKFVFKKLIDVDDGTYKYACFIQRSFLDTQEKEILDLLSNSFDNKDVAEKTKTLSDFIERINTTLGSI
jgi:predicted ribonuclease toxin of YeeF-YezG toxin-antitoxin module